MKLQDFLTEGRELVFRRPHVSSRPVIVQVEHEQGRSKIWTNHSIREVRWFYLDEDGVMHKPVPDQPDSSSETPTLKARPDTTVLVTVAGHAFSIPFLRQHDYLLDTETRLRLATEIRPGDKVRVIDKEKEKEKPHTPEHFVVYEGPVNDFGPEVGDVFLLGVGSGRGVTGFRVDPDGSMGSLSVKQVLCDWVIDVDLAAAMVNYHLSSF